MTRAPSSSRPGRCRRPPPTRTTTPAARPAARRRSTRCCTPPTRCGSGTTTSAPDSGDCWRATSRRARRLARPDAVTGQGLHEAELDVTPDGRTAVVTWSVADPHGARRTVLVAVDTTTGERTTLFDDAAAECGAPVVSPDGTTVAFLRETLTTPEEPIDLSLMVVPVDGSAPAREVAAGWDLWPGRAAWTPDADGLVVVADEQGAAPVFVLDVASGEVRG